MAPTMVATHAWLLISSTKVPTALLLRCRARVAWPDQLVHLIAAALPVALAETQSSFGLLYCVSRLGVPA